MDGVVTLERAESKYFVIARPRESHSDCTLQTNYSVLKNQQ